MFALWLLLDVHPRMWVLWAFGVCMFQAAWDFRGYISKYMRFLVHLLIYMCVYAYTCISMSIYLYVFIYLFWRCVCPGYEVIGLLLANFPWFETSDLFRSVSYHWLWMHIIGFEISDLLVGIYLRLWGLWFVCRSWCQVSVLILGVFPACNMLTCL